MKRIFVSAIYTSPPTTMGGNTKILIELINNLNKKYKFIVLTTEPETFKKNVKHPSIIEIVEIKYPFKKFTLHTHFEEVQYVSKIYNDYFNMNPLTKNDYFFTPSDFAPDVLPIYNLKKKYEFIWIPTLFLFIPNPIENLINGYKFPFLKYVLYYFYQRFLFSKIIEKGNKFVITNDADKKEFPKNLRKKVLAIYGGVNPEEIKSTVNKLSSKKEFDAVFCSRLHPQKGISQLLDIWKLVVEQVPNARLAIIGNGEKSFEKALHIKAKKLKLDKNVTWFGYVNGVEKYKIYKKSKMLVHGTIYDNNGMVAAEALCTGLPVVMYDLKALKKLYTIGCYKVKVGDQEEYADTVIKLLKKKIIIKTHDRINLIKQWNWKAKAISFNQFIEKEFVKKTKFK